MDDRTEMTIDEAFECKRQSTVWQLLFWAVVIAMVFPIMNCRNTRELENERRAPASVRSVRSAGGEPDISP